MQLKDFVMFRERLWFYIKYIVKKNKSDLYHDS